jgi:hypothetical protein
MPGCPLHNACVRPAWLTGRPRSTSTARRPDSRPGSWWDRVSPVGASVLAMTSAHPISSLAVKPPSRAGSLPQEKRVRKKARSAVTPASVQLSGGGVVGWFEHDLDLWLESKAT